MYTVGIDVGSISTDGVILDGERKIITSIVMPTGSNSRRISTKIFGELIEKSGIDEDEISYIVATGYGRENVSYANKQVTEITCHARGAHHIFPSTRTVLDIGGQDSKAISLGSGGEVLDFAMNDKCAAGTGRFLEVMSNALEITLDEMASVARHSQKAISISNFCTVFAESEVISLIHEGTPVEDIAKGINYGVADRVLALLKRVEMVEPITLTGGVIKNRGIVEALKVKLGMKLNVPLDPQIVGALGAAIIAQQYVPTKKVLGVVK